jgi:Ca2+-binding EF-hand superfamily protein
LDQPTIYKLIEDLCLKFDKDKKLITFNGFIDFINEKLGDHNSRSGLNSVFDKLMDKKVREITPKTLQALIAEIGDNLSLEDVKYLLEVVSDPSNDINITSDEFYYIMTKKPAEVDLITPVTKSIK